MRLLFTTALYTLLSATTYAQEAPDAQSIIDKHIEAIGGYKNWGRIKTLKTTALYRTYGDTMVITGNKLRNKAYRIDQASASKNDVMIVTKEGGWESTNGAKATEMDKRKYRIMKQSIHMESILFNFSGSGYAATYIGKDTVAGKQCYEVMVTKNGDVTSYSFDTATYYIIREFHGDVKRPVLFSDFKHFEQGITVPMKETLPDATITILAMEINEPVDEGLFDPKKLGGE
jgi:hypothetical protein